MSKIYTSADQLIGHTPLLELTHIEKEADLKATVLAKLEYFNPAGSVKDRIAKKMIDDAEATGKLKPGSVIIEPTSGNTGIGLAAVAAAKGYRIIIVMPETMSVERRQLMKAYGAELVLSEGAKGMKGAIAKADELAKEIPNAFIPGQFVNPANPQAHIETTGPEIWEDTDGQVDLFVAGVGTGGTVTGPHRIEGIGDDFIPAVVDPTLIDHVADINDLDAIAMAAKIGRVLGLGVGISSGANFLGAVLQNRQPGRQVATVFADDSKKYLTTLLATPPAETSGMVTSRIELLGYEPVETR